MAVLSNTMMQGTAADTGEASYQIEKSLRFNSADLPYLRRTTGRSGNGRTFTISFWFKLNEPTGDQVFFGCSQVHMQYRPTVAPNGTWYFRYEKGSSQLDLQNNESLRDHSAWYHMVFAVDTTQATASDRIKVYINGKLQANVTGSYPDQHDEMRWGNKSYAQSISRGEWDQYAGMQFSDFYTIDGLQLSPAAFGSFDSTGVWNPTAFALPAPNNGTEWSDDDNWSGDEIWGGAGPAPNAFDGDLSTKMLSSYADTTIHWTPPEAITYKQSVRIYIDTTGYFKINDTAEIVGTTGSGSLQWETIYGSGTIEKLTFQSIGGDTVQLAAVEVDGVILIDDQTDVETRTNLNNGTKWSDSTSTGGAEHGSYPKTNAFNGDFSNNGSGIISGGGFIFAPSGGISYTNSVKIRTGTNIGSQTIEINDGTGFNVNADDTWVEVASGSGTLNKLAITASIGGSSYAYLAAIAIDGHVLIDSSRDNSFHLKFSDISTNDRLGRNAFNIDVTTATGALPIRATIAGSDGYDQGETANGTNVRADSLAGTTSGTGLVLACPFDTFEQDAYTDVHQLINTGSSNKAPSFIDANNGTGGDNAVRTVSKFYGKSFMLPGGGSSSVSFSDSADFDFGTGDFTIEGWFRTDGAISTAGMLFSTESSSEAGVVAYLTSSDRKIYLGKSTNNSQTWLVQSGNDAYVESEWTHYAAVRDSGTWKLFVNGVLIGTASDSTDLGGGKLAIGNGPAGSNNLSDHDIQDFRIYKAVAKYSANFTIPTKQDFSVYNLSGVVTEYESPGGPIWSTNSDGTTISSPAAYNGTSKAGADKLVLALPGNSGDTSNSNYLDHSLAIAGTGSTREVTTTGVGNTTSSPKWYGSCLSWDGDGDVLKITDRDTDWQFGTGDFTIEFWGDFEALSSDNHKQGCITNHSSSTMGWVLGWGNYNNTTYFGWWSEGNDDDELKLAVNPPHVQNGGWKHIAVVRYNGNIKLYVNGTQEGSTNDSTNYNYGGDLAIGVRDGDSTNYSHADGTKTADYRIYKGWAKYTSAFTPDPSSPYDDGNEIDSLTDTPTNGGTDTGLGGQVTGNYCTWNPLNNTNTLSQGNLKTTTSGGNECSAGTISITTGKWYYEVDVQTTHSYGYPLIGIAESNKLTGTNLGETNAFSYLKAHTGGTKAGATWGAAVNGDVIGVAVDADNGRIYYAINNTWQNSGDPTTSAATGSEQTWTAGEKTFVPWNSEYTNSASTTNFGQRAFKYTAPSGYKCLCTQNLDDTFSGDELNNPSKYFDVKTWSGNDTADTDIKGFNFGPDFVWIKQLNGTSWHKAFDQIRGVGKPLHQNETNAEATEATTLTAFNSDGFELGTSGTVNASTYNYVGYGWDAGTTAATASTDGDITPSAQWVNATAGFSISKYTGTGTKTDTVGHALGAKPELVIIKDLDSGHSYPGWYVKHKSLSVNNNLKLESNAVQWPAHGVNAWWDGGIADLTSNTVVSFAEGQTTDSVNNVNKSSADYIMYAWTGIPGYSAFGSFTGNGSADGPFVYTGFRPRWIMTKNIETTRQWVIWDTKRSPYNFADECIFPDVADAEAAKGPDSGTDNDIDILSNGFKIRNVDSAQNEDAKKIIYAAFAEHPFKTARAK